MPMNMFNAITAVQKNNAVRRANQADQDIAILLQAMEVGTNKLAAKNEEINRLIFKNNEQEVLIGSMKKIFGNSREPDNIFTYLSRIRFLTGLYDIYDNDLKNMPISDKRGLVLNVIAWTEYLYVTEIYLDNRLERLVSLMKKEGLDTETRYKSINNSKVSKFFF